MNLTIIERELKAIWDARGRLVPAEVVAVAADEAHPLHSFFTWDDTEAASRYRNIQAAGLIRSVKVTITSEKAGEVEEYRFRSWIPARSAGIDAPAGYVPEESIRHDPDARNAILRQMQRDLQVFRRRYQHLAEFWSTLGNMMGQAEAG